MPLGLSWDPSHHQTFCPSKTFDGGNDCNNYDGDANAYYDNDDDDNDDKDNEAEGSLGRLTSPDILSLSH